MEPAKYMALLTQPTNKSQGKGGVASLRVSTQGRLMEAVRVMAKEKRVMVMNHAVENADHERLNIEDVRRKSKGSKKGERTETSVKSQKPGQLACTCCVLVFCSSTHTLTRTVSQITPMRQAMHSSPFKRLCERDVCARRPEIRKGAGSDVKSGAIGSSPMMAKADQMFASVILAAHIIEPFTLFHGAWSGCCGNTG